MTAGNLAYSEFRREDRDEVHHRTRAVHADGRTLQLLIVNISPHGFMARCEAPIADGDKLRVTLPGVGTIPGHVRWALGGRIGCQFDRPLALAHYYELLAILLRQPDPPNPFVLSEVEAQCQTMPFDFAQGERVGQFNLI